MTVGIMESSTRQDTMPGDCSAKFRTMSHQSHRAQLPISRLLPANPLNHTRKSSRREGLFSFSWTLPSGGRSSASGSDLGRSSRGRAPTKYDSVYPIFRTAAQARNGLGHELRRGYSAAMPRL